MSHHDQIHQQEGQSQHEQKVFEGIGDHALFAGNGNTVAFGHGITGNKLMDLIADQPHIVPFGNIRRGRHVTGLIVAVDHRGAFFLADGGDGADDHLRGDAVVVGDGHFQILNIRQRQITGAAVDDDDIGAALRQRCGVGAVADGAGNKIVYFGNGEAVLHGFGLVDADPQGGRGRIHGAFHIFHPFDAEQKIAHIRSDIGQRSEVVAENGNGDTVLIEGGQIVTADGDIDMAAEIFRLSEDQVFQFTAGEVFIVFQHHVDGGGIALADAFHGDGAALIANGAHGLHIADIPQEFHDFVGGLPKHFLAGIFFHGNGKGHFGAVGPGQEGSPPGNGEYRAENEEQQREQQDENAVAQHPAQNRRVPFLNGMLRVFAVFVHFSQDPRR